MVAIDASGAPGVSKTVYERSVVEACLEKLKEHGYFVPDYSYFKIKALQEGSSSVIMTAEKLCLSNRHDIVWI